jgi:peptide chain release factor subunit 1
MITAETVNRILKFHGNGLPVVSLYGRIDPGASPGEVHTRMTSLLDQVLPLAKDQTLEHQSRLSVRADIERIKEAVDSNRWPPGAVAIFSCSGRDLYEEVTLPRRVREQVIVDATPFARPMLAVLSEYHRAWVLVINKASARVWEVDQDEMREVNGFKDRVLRKPDYAANLAEDRVRNKEEELVKKHYRRAVKVLEEDLQQTDGYDLVIIGGHEYEVPEFIQVLPNDLRNRVAGTFSVDPTTAPLAEIRSSASSILERYQREEELRLVSEVFEKAAMGRLAALGLESCLQAAPVAAIKTLLVVQGAIAPGVVCDESRWLAASGDICPLCGKPTRRSPDVIDELVAVVIDEGGSAKHVEVDTKLSEYLVAAELRFPLPPSAVSP